jgi:hypothetical protein
MKTIYSFMVKIFIFSVLIILPFMKAWGQDVIIKKTGEEIKAKVTEILDMDIKYKKFDNLGGPVYSIKKSEVVLIIYENGSKEVINAQNSPVVSQSQQTQNMNSAVTNGRIGRARAGSILNYVLIAPIIGLTAAAVFADDGNEIIGGVATGIGAVGIPVASIIAGNRMKAAGVRGSPGLRIVGWISYGLYIADAVNLLVSADDLDDELIIVSGVATLVLGVTSTTFLGLDKSMKAIQGKSKLGTVSLQPTVGYVRYFNGNKYPTMGIRINF